MTSNTCARPVRQPHALSAQAPLSIAKQHYRYFHQNFSPEIHYDNPY